MTYSEYWETSSAAAARLQDEWFTANGESIRSDDVVPLSLFPNDIFVPMLATLMAGAAYAPLDPKWPEV